MAFLVPCLEDAWVAVWDRGGSRPVGRLND